LSDALTDIRRDEERQRLLGRIRRLEREFLAEPDREKARELERLWVGYARLPHGYWGGPNRSKAFERVAYFHQWRPEDGMEWLARFHREDVVVVRTGDGFVVGNDAFEDLFARAVFEQGCGPFAHSVFRARVRIEVERLTCRACPRFNELCGTVVCHSKVDAELAERWKRVERGRALVVRN
jgi:hypothetical protein